MFGMGGKALNRRQCSGSARVAAAAIPSGWLALSGMKYEFFVFSIYKSSYINSLHEK
ncbi:hypothetical protein [Comamonas humi]